MASKTEKEYNSIEDFLEDNSSSDSLKYIIQVLLERVVDLQDYMIESGLSEEDFFTWQKKNRPDQDYLM